LAKLLQDRCRFFSAEGRAFVAIDAHAPVQVTDLQLKFKGAFFNPEHVPESFLVYWQSVMTK
jgi:hypothetical protein